MNIADDFRTNRSHSTEHSVRVAAQSGTMPDMDDHIEIDGINFSILREGKWVALQCDEWPSLSGYGSTLDEAREMLYEAIEDAKKTYIECDENELTEKALKFRAFIERWLVSENI